MAVLPVDTVFFARYSSSNFRSLYGRLGSKGGYTKDYLQLSKSTAQVLENTFHYNGEPIAFDYVWPGGCLSGKFHHSSDRFHLAWSTDDAPAPWTVGTREPNGPISIPGDSSKTTQEEAEQEYQRIKDANYEPWLVGVVLQGRLSELHTRVYFRSPPAGLEDRGLSALPAQLQVAMASLKQSDTGALVATQPPPTPRAKALVRQIEEALERNPNVLLVGPPGTGKTVALEDLRAKYAVSGGAAPLYFDTDSWSASAFSEGEAAGERRSEALVFHPSYAYENFVAGLFPKASDKGMELEGIPGPLLRLAHWVGRSNRKALLILDEFNRGPAAAIFGDTLGLLDKDKRSTLNTEGAYIQRPYADYAMGVREDYASQAGAKDERIAEQISLPEGLLIVAAMNSTDRSVAPLDAAMRRRFHVIRVLPDYDLLGEHFGLDAADIAGAALPAANDPILWKRREVLTLAVRALRAVNDRVRFCLGDDFLLGHALLWSLAASTDETALQELCTALDGFVLSTLRTTFLDQDDFLAAVLGIPDDAAQAAAQDVRFVGYWQPPPQGLNQVASRRLMLLTLSTLPPQAQLAALNALATP
jgi:5-methylcytosine-specific restriction protein B